MGLFKINKSNIFLKIPSFLVKKAFINLGCTPDKHDSRDKLFSDCSLCGTEPLQEISLKQYFKSVSNQLNLSSCVANAIADTAESRISINKSISPDKVQDFSRLFVYWNSRNLEVPSQTNVDAGTTIRYGCDSINRYGICYEQTWQYIPSNVNMQPSWLAYKEAFQNKITAYYRIASLGEYRAQEIIKALSANHPVVFAATIANSYRSVNSDEVINVPNDNFIGNHAQVITGWSQQKNAFEVRNSWGSDWGVNGYCYISKEYITSSLAFDFWVPTI